MSGPTPDAWLDDPGRRWELVAAVTPYLILAVLVVVTVLIEPVGRSLGVDLVLCGLAAAWMLWMVTLHPGWRERPGPTVLFMVVLLGIVAVLVVRDPWFGFFAPAGYFYAFRLLPWPWTPVGLAAVAVLAGTAQASDVDKSTPGGVAVYLAVLIANVVPMCAFGLLMRRAAVQNDERRRTLAELAEVNRRLAATVAENAALQRRLLERARRDGVHDERARLARELHDTLAQGLVGIVTQLQAAEQAGDDPPAWRRRVTAAIDLARQSLAEARRSVHALRPQPLAGARLAEALAEVTRRWSDLHGVPAEVTVTGTVRPMPPDAEDTLLRTAQEALANVARHAAAGRAGVTLSYLDGEVAVDVRDDGRGFDPADRGGSGFGLVAMGQRIKGLGGTLQVESEPGAGTAISARVPSGGVPSGGEPVGRLPVGRAPVTS